MTEQEINNRISEILDAYAEVLTDEIDTVTVDAVMKDDKPTGDVNVYLSGVTTYGVRKSAERVIGVSDDLHWISDLFHYPEYFGRQSKEIASESVKMAYFDIFGNLVINHSDGSVEKFKIRDEHRKEIVLKLKDNLGNKLKLKL